MDIEFSESERRMSIFGRKEKLELPLKKTTNSNVKAIFVNTKFIHTFQLASNAIPYKTLKNDTVYRFR